MKLNESKVLVILASVILGFLLASQLSGKFIPGEMLTLQSYQKMSSELRELKDENIMLNDKRRSLSVKLTEKQSDQSVPKIIKGLTEELEKYDFLVGLTDVKGPGVVVSLSDNPDYGKIIDTREISINGLVHDFDLLSVVWELKNAGAEAISINDQRIIYITDIYCGGPIISVNGLELVPPYIIKAIGDPESLVYTLNKDSYYNWMVNRGLKVSMRKEDSIKIFKYDKNINYSYMKQIKE